MRVAVAGLTHLGVCLSVAAHEWGVDVVAFDVDSQRVANAKAAEFDPAEPGVVDFLREVGDRYVITEESYELQDCGVVVIAVDTELQETGENDDSEVSELLRIVADSVPASTPIVLASQVRPGFTRAHREIHSELYYFMETLVFGRGIERAQFPERYIIGSPQPEVPLPAGLRDYLALAGCPVHVMSYESAELTKLSANVVLAASITAANSLAELAESVGADWREMEPALREDSRIGQQSYISPGLGIGGANLARDLLGIEALAEARGVNASFARALLEHSNHMRDWTMRVVTRLRQERSIQQLGILGLSYKPGTTSIRGSAGQLLVEALESAIDVLVYDPKAALPARPADSRASIVNSIEQIIAECDVVVVATPWPEFAPYLRESLGSDLGPIVVDPYRQVDKSWARNSCSRLVQLGVSGE